MAPMPEVSIGEFDASHSPLSRRGFLKLAAPGLVALITAACGRGEVAPTIPPDVPAAESPAPLDIVATATAEALPSKPTATPGLFSDYMEVYSPQDQAWVAVNQEQDVAASWNSKDSEWSYRFETIAQDERIDIFDANSFPDKFREIAKNWLTATDEEWQMYQEFVEAARADFFEEQGITSEVAAMTGINENLRSLWGMIYYIQTHREEAIANRLMPVVTPTELRTILEDEPSFQRRDDEKKIPEGTVSVSYGLNSLAFYPPYEYNSSTHGTILGRIDVSIGRDLSPGADGILAAMALPLPNNPNYVVELLAMKAPQGGGYDYDHILYADLVVLDENYILPEGTTCLVARVGEQVHAESIPSSQNIPPPTTIDKMYDALGTNVLVRHVVDLGSTLGGGACADPTTGLEVATEYSARIRGGAGWHDTMFSPWPWQQQ